MTPNPFKLFFCTIFLFMYGQLSAKPSKIDSLNSIISRTSDPVDRIKCFIELSKQYYNQSEQEKAIKQAKSAIEIAEKYHMKTYYVDACLHLSKLFLNSFVADSALFYGFQGIKQINALSQKRELGSLYKNIGIAYYYKDDIISSLEYNERAFREFQSINDTSNIIKCNLNISVAYNILGNFESATHYIFKAIALAEESNCKNKTLVAHLYNNLGSIYMGERKFNKALPYLLKSNKLHRSTDNEKVKLSNLVNLGATYHEIRKYDSSIYYHNILIKKAIQLGYREKVAFAYTNLSVVYIDLGNNKKAYEYAKKAIDESYDLDIIKAKIGSNTAMALVLESMKQYRKAIFYLKKGLELAELHQRLAEASQITKHLSMDYSKTGNYKLAYNTLLKHKQLSDSLSNEENNKAMTKIELEYEFNKKQQTLEMMARQKEYEQNLIIKKQKSQRNLAIISLLPLLILVVLIFFISRSIQQKKAHKLKEALYITKQQELCQQMNPHFIFNTLNSIQSFILKNKTKESISYLTRFAELMRRMLNNSQDYLIPLKDELEVLKVYCDLESLRFDKPFNFYIFIDDSLNTNNSKIPPFILQPLLENAIKHGIEPLSKTGEINLKVENSLTGIRCLIENNGVGKDCPKTNQNKKHTSIASKIITKRLNILSLYYKKQFYYKLENIKSDTGSVLGVVAEINIPILN